MMLYNEHSATSI